MIQKIFYNLIYLIPGVFQLSKRKFIFGIFFFTITICSILFYIKLKLFSITYDVTLVYMTSLIFLFNFIIHLLSIVFIKTSSKNIFDDQVDLYEKGRLALLKQNYELAILCFEASIKKQPDDQDVIYQLGKAYVETGQNKKAKKIFDKNRKKIGPKWKYEIESLYEELK